MTEARATTSGIDPSQIKAAESLLRHLSAAARNRLFYPSDHSIIKRSIAVLSETAVSLMSDRLDLTIDLLGEDWIVQGSLLHKASALAVDLKERMVERELTSITILRGFVDKDIEALIGMLTADPTLIREKGATAHLRSLGASAVSAGRVTVAERGAGTVEPEQAAATLPELTIPAELLRKGAEVVSQIYCEAGEGAIDLQKAREIVTDVMDLVGSRSTELSAMVGIKDHDNYTFTHIVNVCVLTLAQTKGMNLSEEALNEIGLAALMHDLGKQRIPTEIIQKPRRLTADEFELMKMHTIYGAEMLRAMPAASELPVMVAFEHHLRYDCTGYPSIKRRRELHPATYMTTIADAFDAMRTSRPYSGKMSSEEIAVRMEVDSGTHFEPRLLRRFFRILDLFPSGSSVCLSTGEEAVVVERRAPDCMHPVVRVTKDIEGQTLEDGPVVDLACTQGSPQRSIAGPAGSGTAGSGSVKVQ